MQEPLALDVIRDPVSDLGGRLDRYAGDLSARFDGFGVAESTARPSLLRDLSNRWTLPTAGTGLIEVFDGDDFGGLMRHWGSREGYLDGSYGVDSPFVIPVDPVEHVQGLTGRHMRRPPDRRRAMRPVAARSPRPMVKPRARERWRTVATPDDAAPQYSAYPPALGRAGAIDATLLRFPTATAEVADGPDRAVVVDARIAPRAWSPSTTSLLPAQSAAEQLSDDIGARLAPEPAALVDAWLVPADASPAIVDRAQRSALARPGRRRDTRIPLRAFTPRIGRAPSMVGPAASTPSAMRQSLADPPGALVTPIAGETFAAEHDAALTPLQANAQPERAQPERAQPERAQPAAVTRPALDRQVLPSQRSTIQPDIRVSATRPSPATPWRAPQSAPPGRPLFVPAALAQLARQVGSSARPSATPDAAWPWAAPAPTPTVQAFDFARRADDGVLIQAVAERAEAPPTRGERRPPPAQPTVAPTNRVPPRPPGSDSPAVTAAPQIVREPPRSNARDPVLDGGLVATPDAPPAADPTLAGLDALISGSIDVATARAWQTAAAASPALAQAIAQLDRLHTRPTIGLQGRAASIEAPPDQPAATTESAPLRPFTQLQAPDTRIADGLSVLSGAPASTALFSQTWRSAPPMIRAVLAAAGFGPDATERPGAAFSFGERLAAVAADVSARHGLTTAGDPAGSLDAPWFSEPTGTLVVPMAATADDDPSTGAPGRQRPARAAASATAAVDRPPATVPTSPGLVAGQPALVTPPTIGPARAQPVRAQPARALAPRALRAALRGARRLATQRPDTARATLRPIPRLNRLTAPIAPDALSLLGAVQSAPPALMSILARAETLLAAGDTSTSAVSTLARTADLPSLISLARMAEVPEAVAALSDPSRAPLVMRALQRAIAIETRADRTALALPDMADAQLIEPVAEPPAQPMPGQTRASGESPQTRAPDATRSPATQAEQVLAAVTSALPSALRAALAAASSASASRMPAPSPAMPAALPTAATPPSLPSATPTPAIWAPRSAASHTEPRAVGSVAQRMVEWAQTVEGAAPTRFDQLAIDAGDAAQSPIARKIITPAWGRSLDATLLSAPDPTPAHRVHRAPPIGRIGRRSEALTSRIDGLGVPDVSASPTATRGAAASADRTLGAPLLTRAAWQRAEATPFVAARSDDTAPHREASAARRAMRSAADAPQGILVEPATSPLPDVDASPRARTRAAAGAVGAQRPVAPGLQAGRFKWPRVALEWVQAVAADPSITVADWVLTASAQSDVPKVASRERSHPGARSLESLALSSRILVRGLDGMGLLGAQQRPSGPDPLGPIATTAPTMQLQLGLPVGDDTPTLVAERFADRTIARQVPPTAQREQVASAPKSTRFDLDVDWVQPLQAVDTADGQLAPRLRSPGNIRRAIGVWVDAVKAEAERSPAAARQALGSVGQLIDQFRMPSASMPTVRPSSILRGSVFDGPSPVIIESPEAGEARPALIRPGEHAAKQALRKGNNETMQVSGGAQTVEESRHKNAEQTDELMPPEEVERLADEVIERIKRELEFDAARTGEDGWD